jgi:hypothetical protein
VSDAFLGRDLSFTSLPVTELAQLAVAEETGLAYIEFLLLLRETPAAISGHPPTQLSGDTIDGVNAVPDVEVPGASRELVSIARLNANAATRLATSFRSALFERSGIIALADLRADEVSAMGLRDLAERLQRSVTRLREVQQAGSSMVRAIDWDFGRIWDTVGPVYAGSLDAQSVIAEIAGDSRDGSLS